MSVLCSVKNCGTTSAEDNVVFYKFGTTIDRNDAEKVKLLELQKQAWLNAIHEMSAPDEKIENAKICNKHFKSGRVK